MNAHRAGFSFVWGCRSSRPCQRDQGERATTYLTRERTSWLPNTSAIGRSLHLFGQGQIGGLVRFTYYTSRRGRWSRSAGPVPCRSSPCGEQWFPADGGMGVRSPRDGGLCIVLVHKWLEQGGAVSCAVCKTSITSYGWHNRSVVTQGGESRSVIWADCKTARGHRRAFSADFGLDSNFVSPIGRGASAMGKAYPYRECRHFRYLWQDGSAA